MARSPRPARKTSPSRQETTARKSSSAFTATFEQHQSTAVDSLLRLLSEPLGSLLTWVVIGIAIALPLCLLLLLQNLQNVGTGMDQNSTISLYLDKQLPETEQQALVATLSAREDVAEVVLITAEVALAEFETRSGFADVLQGLDENPLPPVLLVTPQQAGTAEVTALFDELKAQPEVELAQIDLQWLQRLNAIVDFALRLAVLLALLLGLGVVLVIGNTVRMAIENRRAEIVVVKLVGGTDAYVSRPFLYTGFWYGIGGGLVALLVIFISLFVVQGPVNRLLGAYGSDFAIIGLGISNSFLVVLIAAALGWLGAWVSVLRHLRAIEPK